MSKSRFRETSITSLAILLTIATAKPAASLSIYPIMAQSPTLQMPTTVPSGTTIDIDGSNSMAAINQALKQRFENQFPNTVVQLNSGGNDAALQALRAGKIDLAAIGRPLTDAEKAEGLVLDPLSRPKIAIVVSEDNLFRGSLTTEQFAKIFRGEITNWSEVGGAAGAIRLIDRPESNDTRLAFQAYPIFQQSPFATGANALKLADDSTEAIVKELGKDGISYAIVDQVKEQAGVRIVPMHDTLPTDPRYPFSQPLSYVYQGPEPNADVRAFLGYIADPQSQMAVAADQASEVPAAIVAAPASPVVAAPPAVSQTPLETATPTTSSNSDPWALWWLALPLLGGLLWWLLKRNPSDNVVSPVVSPVAAARAVLESRIILVPRSCKAAYAYWEVPEATKEMLRQSTETLTVRLYDVTDIDLETQKAQSVQQFECDIRSQDQHLPIPLDNRDYIAELGYLTTDNRWLNLARSAHVRVPACPVPSTVPSIIPNTVPNAVEKGTAKAASRLEEMVKPLGAVVAGAAIGGTVIQSAIAQPPARESRIILTPRNDNDLYAYWEVSEDHKAELRQQGGRKMALRLHNGTEGIDSDSQSTHSVQEYECSEQDNDLHVPVFEHNRNYVAELGYVTDTGRWLNLARSTSVQVPALPKQEVKFVKPDVKQIDVKPVPVDVEPVDIKLVDVKLVDVKPVDVKPVDVKPVDVKPVDTVPVIADSTVEKSVVSKFLTGRVQHYGDFTPGDAATVQSYGDFTPSDTASIQHYGDFTPGDAATVQSYGKSKVDQAIANDGAKFNAVTTSQLESQYLKSDDSSAGDRVGQNSRIILVSRSPKTAYAYWEISSADRETVKRQGGTNLILRVYEVTNIDMDDIPAHSVQQFECDEKEQDHHVTIPLGDRDYVAEVGYATADGRWLSIIRSLHVRVPAV